MEPVKLISGSYYTLVGTLYTLDYVEYRNLLYVRDDISNDDVFNVFLGLNNNSLFMVMIRLAKTRLIGQYSLNSSDIIISNVSNISNKQRISSGLMSISDLLILSYDFVGNKKDSHSLNLESVLVKLI